MVRYKKAREIRLRVFPHVCYVTKNVKGILLLFFVGITCNKLEKFQKIGPRRILIALKHPPTTFLAKIAVVARNFPLLLRRGIPQEINLLGFQFSRRCGGGKCGSSSSPLPFLLTPPAWNSTFSVMAKMASMFLLSSTHTWSNFRLLVHGYMQSISRGPPTNSKVAVATNGVEMWL